jgi:hypothetical protein
MFRPLVAHGAGPVAAGDSDEAGAVAGAVLLPGAAGPDALGELGELAGADGELDDDEQTGHRGEGDQRRGRGSHSVT